MTSCSQITQPSAVATAAGFVQCLAIHFICRQRSRLTAHRRRLTTVTRHSVVSV